MIDYSRLFLLIAVFLAIPLWLIVAGLFSGSSLAYLGFGGVAICLIIFLLILAIDVRDHMRR